MTTTPQAALKAAREALTVCAECLDKEKAGTLTVDRFHEYARGDIAAALSAIAAEEAQDWIPVTERLPETDDQVIVWIESAPGNGYAMIDSWHLYREDPTGMGGPTMDMGYIWRENDPMEVTHWQPLPAAPGAASTRTGWQLVPREVSKAMKDAAMEILLERGDIYSRDGQIVIETITPSDLWRAMLAAAPGADAPSRSAEQAATVKESLIVRTEARDEIMRLADAYVNVFGDERVKPAQAALLTAVSRALGLEG